MNTNKVFCAECRKDVNYSVSQQQMTRTLKGESYNYNGKTAKCVDCGEEIYVPSIEDDNLKALYDAYRQQHGIISLEKILELPQKYAIGKRPFSLLLGWGEQTFTRYCEGDMPTKQYSDTLQMIYDDPTFYLKLLESNKCNLKSLTSYEKSKRITEGLLGMEVKLDSKIDLAIEYLLNQCEDITHLALQKALYYTQGFFFAFTNKYFFEDDCEAWQHGPVYREIYNRYSGYRFDPIENSEEFDATIFSVSEKAVLDSVIKNLCCYSGKILEQFTHSETPWIKTRGDLPEDAPSDRIIDKQLICEYFTAVKSKYNLINTFDIKSYAQTMFSQI